MKITTGIVCTCGASDFAVIRTTSTATASSSTYCLPTSRKRIGWGCPSRAEFERRLQTTEAAGRMNADQVG